MDKYYFDFIKRKLEKDIIRELISKNADNHEIILDEISKYFNNDIVFIDDFTSSGTHQKRNRDAYKDKKNRCRARIWNEGLGGQCSCSGKKEYNDYCKRHFNKENEWWLGTINKSRPERPIHLNGKVHHWLNNES